MSSLSISNFILKIFLNFLFQAQRFKYRLQLQELSLMIPSPSPRLSMPWASASSKSFSVLSLVFAGWQIPWRLWFSVFCHQPYTVNGESVSTNKLFLPPLSSLEWCWALPSGAKCLTNMEGKDFLNFLIYRTRAIITRSLYTFYPLFEVHLCTVTVGLMYG